jgi:hypothetical protein
MISQDHNKLGQNSKRRLKSKKTTYKIHDGHDEGPEEGGEDAIGKIGHHQPWTNH